MRGNGFPLGLLAVLALSLPASAGAATKPAGELTFLSCFSISDPTCTNTIGNRMGSAADVAATDDGQSVYVVAAASGINRFQRQPNGSLADGGCFAPTGNPICGGAPTQVEGLQNPRAVAVSHDGKSVYVVADVTLVRFNRADDGTLTPAGCFVNTADLASFPTCAPVDALDNATSAAIPPDDENLYISAADTDAVITLNRAADGALSSPTCIDQAAGPPCALNAPSLTVPNDLGVDNAGVYATSSAGGGNIQHFPRAVDGSLSVGGCYGGAPCNVTSGVANPAEVALSGDGKSAYVAALGSDVLTHLDRSPAGALTFRGCFGAVPTGPCTNKMGALFDPNAVSVSPDGTSVHTAANSGPIASFAREPDGSLTYAGCLSASPAPASDCAGMSPGLSGASALWSPNATTVYATAASSIFARYKIDAAPVCSPTSANTASGTSVALSFPCTDANGDAITRSALFGPFDGTLGPFDNTAATATYTPAAGFAGSDAVAFQATANGVLSNATTATVNVAAAPVTPPPPPPPVAPPVTGPTGATGPSTPGPAVVLSATRYTVTAGRTITLRYAGSGPGTVVLTVKKGSRTSATIRGRLTRKGIGTLRVSAAKLKAGAYRLSLVLTDSARRTATDTATLTVKPKPKPKPKKKKKATAK